MRNNRKASRPRSTAEIHADYRRTRHEMTCLFIEREQAALSIGGLAAEDAFKARIDEAYAKRGRITNEAFTRPHTTIEDIAMLAEIALDCSNYDLDGALSDLSSSITEGRAASRFSRSVHSPPEVAWKRSLSSIRSESGHDMSAPRSRSEPLHPALRGLIEALARRAARDDDAAERADVALSVALHLETKNRRNSYANGLSLAPEQEDGSVSKVTLQPTQRSRHPTGNAVDMTEVTADCELDQKIKERKDKAAVSLGRRGGKARAASMTPAQRTEIARKAAAKRWGK